VLLIEILNVKVCQIVGDKCSLSQVDLDCRMRMHQRHKAHC
jgi:hypothetical protein